MKYLLCFLLLVFAVPVNRILAQNEIFLEDGHPINYANLAYSAKEPTVTISTGDENKVIPKKDILAFSDAKGKLFTFQLRTGRKLRIKTKGSLTDTCTKASIHAYKYFKIKDTSSNPYLAGTVSSDANSCYEQQTKKIRTGRTVGIVGTVVAVNIALGALISSMNDLNSL